MGGDRGHKLKLELQPRDLCPNEVDCAIGFPYKRKVMQNAWLIIILLANVGAFAQDIVSICKSNGLSKSATVEKVLTRNWLIAVTNSAQIKTLVRQKTILAAQLAEIQAKQRLIDSSAGQAFVLYHNSPFQAPNPDGTTTPYLNECIFDNELADQFKKRIAEIDAATKAAKEDYFIANRTNVVKFVDSKF